jgi:hypothetical protein
MTPYQQWQVDSEAATRFYRAIIAIEDGWKAAKWAWFNYRLRRRNLWIKELPPIVHNGTVWGEA